MTLPPGLAGPRAILVLDLYDDQLPTEQTRVLHCVVQPRQLLVPDNMFCESIIFMPFIILNPGLQQGARQQLQQTNQGQHQQQQLGMQLISQHHSGFEPGAGAACTLNI